METFTGLEQAGNKINLANSENPDETAHKELSRLHLLCLQMCARIYLMSEFTRLYPEVFASS